MPAESRLTGRWFLALLAVGYPTACHQESATPSAQSLAQFPVVHASLDCAPWDGPAMSVLLARVGDTTESPTGPFVRVALYGSLDRLVGNTTRWPADKEVGTASWCSAGAQECTAAATGVVRLEGFAPDSVLPGKLRITFPDGRILDGSFRANWRSRRMMCG
jgi:hypothetical protein